MSNEFLTGTGTQWPRPSSYPRLRSGGDGLTLRGVLKRYVAAIEGVKEIRLLPNARRRGRHCDKVFIVLNTHNIERDAQLVDLMSQLENVDYDLVPATAADMIPSTTDVL